MNVRIYCNFSKKETGVESYARNVIKHLSFNPIINNNKGKLSQFIITTYSKQNITHCTTPLPFFLRKPKGNLIVTVHDIIPILYPQYHPLKRALYFKYFLKPLLKKADKIISVSEATKKDLVGKLNIEERKIKVIHLGVSEKFKPTEDISVLKKYGINKNYIFFLGTIEPRKNVQRLIEAYNKLECEDKLVIAGGKGWGEEVTSNNENIVFTSYVDEKDLPALYSHATLFVYPSLYEGFGLPVLEAMACGTPVITSNISSLQEVSGNAAVLCDPMNVEDIKDKIRLVLDDNQLQESLRVKGLERATKFNWEKCARETEKVYEELL